LVEWEEGGRAIALIPHLPRKWIDRGLILKALLGEQSEPTTMNDDTRVSQLAEYHRFYGDMRFKQLTLFMAAMSAAGAGVMQFPERRWWIALGALFVTGVMWVVEVRATLAGIAAHNAILALFPDRKIFWPWINSSWAVLSLHMGFYALWLATIRAWGPAACVSFYIGILAGLMLLSFSIVNYCYQRTFWIR